MTQLDEPRQRRRGPSASRAPSLATATDADIRAAYAEMVGQVAYPCVGAKSAFARDQADIEVFDRMADRPSTIRLQQSLANFSASHPAEADRDRPTPQFATFVAVFRYPQPATEQRFERLLWRQLQLLHEVDDIPWDASVSSDPANPHFGFSVAGRAFFVIGMHQAASRQARRAPLATLVFNLHSQFEQLRSTGHYDRMRDVIRTRDVALQGSINPMAQDFGSRSEARQYSGRAVPEDWIPPYSFGTSTSGDAE